MKPLDQEQAIACLVPSLPAPDELLPYLNRMAETRWYSNQGPLYSEFKQAVIAQLSSRNPELPPVHGEVVSSGTAALELALMALKLAPGSYVLVPALTFVASALAVLRVGLVPVICDIDADSWQLTPDMAKKVANQRPIAAVLPVATFGIPVETKPWDDFVEDTQIPVVIDAAAAFAEQKVGQRSNLVVSFHATKLLGIGEGGGVFSRQPDFIEAIHKCSNFGLHQGASQETGFNAKLSEYHAAVGLAQLARWPELYQGYRECHRWYMERINHWSGISSQPGAEHFTPGVEVLLLECEADFVQSQLQRQSIETRRWYYPALHCHPAILSKSELATEPGQDGLAVVDRMSQYLLGFPYHLYLTEQEVDRVMQAIGELTPLKGVASHA
ncbi:DegT/DnrJ/EryC1/StrS aminotransferase family protein [Pleionea sp. CnH1-48]|uniref:DegT/DnrJ/EryC1/StrS family aminotransferase n=1 Tax=Pleionea sp. CnH1-48 TaxID=2954494 RepID=UPI0020969D6A|nr:DegT/DnrJ/EryC1/StrS family aminotransferase [Pleionea sp. CnH1-48]MCO7226142.1 DegT/DnrJ/EryC1/StrS family aminotransferase [Pleionea sp. CnH1-48]